MTFFWLTELITNTSPLDFFLMGFITTAKLDILNDYNSRYNIGTTFYAQEYVMFHSNTTQKEQKVAINEQK